MSFYCYGCLKVIEKEGYCSSCVKKLWGGNRKVSFVLPFDKKEYPLIEMEQAAHLSISGVQDKISLALIDNELKPVSSGGEYLLKPVPSASIIPAFDNEIPANEHLTMQIASQVFKLKVAINGLMRFPSGELVYITKRFDRKNEKKFHQEDFCQLSNRTSDTHGKNYKYDSSYAEIGEILSTYCKAYKIEIEKIFQVIIFNFLVGNGDAHLKNFSLYYIDNDYLLTPFYDLLATSLHFPKETWFALDLLNAGFTKKFLELGFPTSSDFMVLADSYGIAQAKAKKYIDIFLNKIENIEKMVEKSFLSSGAKDVYLKNLLERAKALTI